VQPGNTIRIIQDPPLSGPDNMARDESLMTLVGEGESQPTLRLYQWAQPTISLGYFQPYAAYLALPSPLGELPVVRRLTGGGAILHDQELTYSLALSTDEPLLSNGANRLYELMHEAVMRSFGEMGIEASPCGTSDDSTPTRGPFFCFARRHCFDVIVNGDKMVGSAQRRTRQAILQHGSIVIADDFDVQSASQPNPLPYDAIEKLRKLVPNHAAQTLGQPLALGGWNAHEIKRVEELIVKYRGQAWIRRA